jgi:histidine decarboxylase
METKDDAKQDEASVSQQQLQPKQPPASSAASEPATMGSLSAAFPPSHLSRIGSAEQDILEDKVVAAFEDQFSLSAPYGPERDAEEAAAHGQRVMQDLLVPYAQAKQRLFAGYQCDMGVHTRALLGPLLDMSLNNIGDPYAEAPCRVSTKAVERAVVRYWTQVWRAPEPSRAGVVPTKQHHFADEASLRAYYDEAWGMVLTMGSTEGNLWALRTARDYLKGKFLIEELYGQEDPQPLVDDGMVPAEGAPRAPPGETTSLSQLAQGRPVAEHLVEHVRSLADHAAIGRVLDEHEQEQMQRMVLVAGMRVRELRREPVLLYSTASHYSIDKIKDLTELHTPQTLGPYYAAEGPDGQPWPRRIAARVDGTTDLDALEAQARFFVERGHRVILVCNYGSTFTGAHDDVHAIYARLHGAGLLRKDYWYKPHASGTAPAQHKDHLIERSNFWLHVDGALGAFYGAFFNERAPEVLAQTAQWTGVPLEELPRLPAFDYGSGCGTMSIVMSAHKAMGSPFPSGIVTTHRKHMLDFSSISYIGSADTTIAGSRNGLAPVVMWDYAQRHSAADHARKYLAMLDTARYAERQLEAALDCPANLYGGAIVHVRHSLAVLFPRPSQELVDKYSLSCDNFVYGVPALAAQQADQLPVSHIYCMGQVTRALIDELVRDLAADAKVQAAVEQYRQREAAGMVAPMYGDDGRLVEYRATQ